MKKYAKVTVLGCGYGMGWRRFVAWAAEWGLKVTEGEAQRLVQSFRTVYKEIEWSWRAFEQAVNSALRSEGVVEVLGHVVDATDKRAMSIQLPSARRIWYQGAALEIVKTEHGAARQFRYNDRELNKGANRISSWGGKIVENITQAGCRDLLTEAIRKCYEQGITVLCSVHDEIVCLGRTQEAEAVKAQLHRIMRTMSGWCRDLPMDADGYISQFYRK